MNAIKPPSLLYYPDFYPDPVWLRAILLLTDEVKRIVPTDVPLNDPEAIREITGELGVLTNIAPKTTHITPFGYSLDWLERVFELLGLERTSRKESKKVTIKIDGGHIEFSGYTFLFDEKIAQEVRALLEKNNLVDEKLQAMASQLSNTDGKTLVVKEASNIVLSFIADRIAREEGLTAITDQPLDFAMNALNGLNVPVHKPIEASEGGLTSAFASVFIPKEIGTIPFSDYKILHQRSDELRAAFGKFVQACHDTCRLNQTENPTKLQAKVKKCAESVEQEFRKFQTGSSKALRLLKWAPFSIGGILLYAKEFLPREVSSPIDIAAYGLPNIKEVFLSKGDQTKEKIFRLAAEMGSDIRALPQVSKLLN